MKIGKLTLNGVTESRDIEQDKLTSECWLVQFKGLSICKTCSTTKEECGGKRIKNTGKNSKGYTVPI